MSWLGTLNIFWNSFIYRVLYVGSRNFEFIKGGDFMSWLADLAWYWWAAIIGVIAYLVYYFVEQKMKKFSRKNIKIEK